MIVAGHGAEPFEEDAAIVLFFVGVRAVGMRCEVDHGRVGLRGLVKAAQNVEQQAFVVAGFQARGVQLTRFADCGQRIFKLSLAALDLRDVYKGLGVLRVGCGKQLILLLRLVELVVAEQCLGQGVHGVQVARLHVERALIGRNGVLGLLQLVVGCAQCELHLRCAVVHRDVFN